MQQQPPPLLAPAVSSSSGSAAHASGTHLPANTSAILQQARAGLTTALREVRTCRAQRQQCADELSACQRGGEAQAALKQAQVALKKEKEAFAELRQRAESLSATAKQQLTTKHKELLDARAADEQCRKRLEGARQAEAQQAAVQQQLGVLRRKLEQKEQIENALEGRHSRLTEVYKSLESECQVELQKCRSASGAPSPGPPPDGGAEATAAAARADGGGDASCARPHDAQDYRLLLAVFAAGAFVGWIARGGSRAGRSIRPARPSVEEIRGWMPSADNMKLS